MGQKSGLWVQYLLHFAVCSAWKINSLSIYLRLSATVTGSVGVFSVRSFLFHKVNGTLISPVISSNMYLFFRWNLEPSSTMFSSLMMQILPKNLGRAPGERQRWALKLVWCFICLTASVHINFDSRSCAVPYIVSKKKIKKRNAGVLNTGDPGCYWRKRLRLFLVMVASLLAFKIPALLEKWNLWSLLS